MLFLPFNFLFCSLVCAKCDSPFEYIKTSGDIIMLRSNCHTHTVFCDGTNSPSEMAAAAEALGFESLGFSAHSPFSLEKSYALDKKRVGVYIDEIKRLKNEYSGRLEIVNGIELDADSTGFDTSKFDFVIGSVHQLHFENRTYSVDYTPQMLSECSKKEFDGSFLKLAEFYYSAVAEHICKRKPEVVGHFDLIEKFNENQALFDSSDPKYQKTALEFAERICDELPNVIFEVNTGAMFRCGRSVPYPAKFILKYLHDKKMRITVTSDAHCVEALNFGFEKASELCRDCGFKTQFAVFGDEFEERAL